MSQLQKGDKKLLNAWAFYDWANSVYTLTIATAIFPIFYASLFTADNPYVDFMGFSFKNSALISFVTASAFLTVALLSPLLSGVADFVGNKKFFLKFFCYLGALSCIGLYWFSIEHLGWSLLCYFMGLIGFWGSLVFYNSYLPDIAFPEQQDAISAKGYSLGYIGSVILLCANLAMVLLADRLGITPEQGMRYAFISVGIWWIGFSQYTYYYLPKGVSNGHRVTSRVFLNGFRELRKVSRQLSEYVALRRFLNSFFVYSMAVQTVMLIATYFGAQEIRWESAEQSTIGLIVCILLIQLVAVAGAQLTARSSARFGNIPVLICLNIMWLGICIGAYFISTPQHFYGMAVLVGLVMGGIQSLSRSTYSKLLPPTQDTASFFSFYDVSEKIGIVIGMLVYGLIDQITGSPRSAIVFLAVFFSIGIVLLYRVPRNQTT